MTSAAPTSDLRDRPHRDGPPVVVAIGGSLTAGSSTEQALRYALRLADEAGAETVLITGSDLDLPLYSPAAATDHPGALKLSALLRRADGILIGSPSYHGSISGVMKNALDYAENLRTDVRPYFSGRAVGCVATAGGWAGAVHTLGVLRDIVHALRGWPTPMGVAINTATPAFVDGECLDPRVAQGIELMIGEVINFQRAHWKP